MNKKITNFETDKNYFKPFSVLFWNIRICKQANIAHGMKLLNPSIGFLTCWTRVSPPVLLSNKRRNHTLNDKNRMFFSCKTKHTLLKSRKERSEDWCIVRYLRNTILSNSDRWINWSFKPEWKSSLYTFFSPSKAFEDLNCVSAG